MIIILILIVLNISYWINVRKLIPLPDCLSFTSIGGFYELFFLFSPHAPIIRGETLLAIEKKLTALRFRYISVTPSLVEAHTLGFVPRVFKLFFFFFLMFIYEVKINIYINSYCHKVHLLR